MDIEKYHVVPGVQLSFSTSLCDLVSDTISLYVTLCYPVHLRLSYVVLSHVLLSVVNLCNIMLSHLVMHCLI